MKSAFTVFLSSTYSDLALERKAVINAVRKLRLQHDSMEFFGARNTLPLETCLEEVRQSDLLVVIVAHKYGSVVPNTTISFTEAEYNEGWRLGKPCLVYFRSDNVPVLPKHIERDPLKTSALEAFKETLRKRHTVATFSDPHDLALSVAVDLARLIYELEQKTKTEETKPTIASNVKNILTKIIPYKEREPKIIPLHGLVEKAMETVAESAQHQGVELEYENNSGTATVKIVEDMMAMAIRNLLDNAIEASIHPNLDQSKVKIHTYTEEQMAIVAIENQGEPIHTDELERVFELYYQGRSARARGNRGIGFGLWYARLVAISHGGNITLSSRPSRHDSSQLHEAATYLTTAKIVIPLYP